MSSPPAAHLTTALAGRYRIERELGAGGMATVFLAQDLRHNRRVAVKVLDPEIAATLGTERFLREIETTANLQHPHILPLFDSGQSSATLPDGTVRRILYYVMPYVQGLSLRARLVDQPRIAEGEAARIASEVADALGHAHAHGVVHRDIKPENILLSVASPSGTTDPTTGGMAHALVADFGIAKAVSTLAAAQLTQTGLALGTPAYMSPEQALGDTSIGAATDIYSLGCVLFEMLTGEAPFAAPTPQRALARRLTESAPVLRQIVPDTDEQLSALVERMLASDAGMRPMAGEVATVLRASLTRPNAPARSPNAAAGATAVSDDAAKAGLDVSESTTDDRGLPSLVVLPFVNYSADPDNEYFADGLTEEIIADLSQLRGLRVISRNSAMMLKGTRKDTPTIGRELDVTHVVTGAVRRVGSALRVTTELVAAARDVPIWSEKYSGTLEDVFGIQEEIARRIVGALEVKLTPREARLVGDRPIEDVVAYDCYLRARQALYDWLPESLDRAERLVDQALGIVGPSALLLATKAHIQWTYVNVMIRPDERYLDRALDLTTQALAIDPDHYLGIFVRGIVAGLRGEAERALVDLRRAHELRPGDSNILVELCRFSQAAGLREIRPFVDEVLRVDPLFPISWFGPAFTDHLNGRFQDAVPAARRAIELAGVSSPLHIHAAWVLASAGLRDEAMSVLRQVGADLAGTVNESWALFLFHALAGDAARALAHVSPELARAAAFVESVARVMAGAYALIGRTDDAIEWTRIAIRRGFINYPFLSSHDPFLASIRSDPRFVALMVEVRPRWEALVEWERRMRS